ncbi:MAG: hypothetical protein AB2693_34220 [Candidatus Thiodiazotropha sp.]
MVVERMRQDLVILSRSHSVEERRFVQSDKLPGIFRECGSWICPDRIAVDFEGDSHPRKLCDDLICLHVGPL